MALPPGLVRIDRASPVPLYFQVAAELERAIESGRLPAGTMLDNEIQLAGQFRLSRATMRRAMQSLADKGLLVRRRGIGTQVVRPLVRRKVALSSLYEDLAAGGQHPTTSVLHNGVEPADGATARALGLPEGAPVLVVDRLRYAGDEPIARLRNHLAAEHAALLDDEALEQHGLYELLRGAGVDLHAATQTIGARAGTAAEARMLNETRGATLLTMERTAYDEQGRAVEFGSHVYRASRYSFQLSLPAQ